MAKIILKRQTNKNQSEQTLKTRDEQHRPHKKLRVNADAPEG